MEQSATSCNPGKWRRKEGRTAYERFLRSRLSQNRYNPHKKNLHKPIGDGFQCLCWKHLSKQFSHVDFWISFHSSPFTWTHKLERTSWHLTAQTSNGVKLELCSAHIFLAHINWINCILPAAHTLKYKLSCTAHTVINLYTPLLNIQRGAGSTACRVTQKKKDWKYNLNKQL